MREIADTKYVERIIRSYCAKSKHFLNIFALIFHFKAALNKKESFLFIFSMFKSLLLTAFPLNVQPQHTI